MFSDIIAVLTLIAVVIQLFYLYFFFYRADTLREKLKSALVFPGHLSAYAVNRVSVIICAKNEAENLAKNLPFVLQQDYRHETGSIYYEVLVVNDQSTDGTKKILTDLQQQYPHLHCIHIDKEAERTLPGKKFALSKAIAAATHDILVMTDADCMPASDAWLRWMAYPFTEGKEIVAGYGPVKKTRGLLNRFVRMETFHTYLQYLTYNLAGIPYMAVGRNLACKKTLLERAQQHEAWSKTPSGDDDLLVNLCATRDNMTVNVSPGSFTWSESKPTWKEWLLQKQRHVSAGKYYNPKAKKLAGIYAASQAMCWVGLLCCLCFRPEHSILLSLVLGGFFMRFCLFFALYTGIMYRFEAYRLRLFWPLFDFGWMMYNFALAPYIFWKNKQQWK